MSGTQSSAANDKVIPVKVALRIRPLVKRELDDGCIDCLRTVVGEPQVIIGKDKAFTYDYVFSKNSPQIEVYEQSVQPLLHALFKGYNATVLAYGQTGSGKTFSMGSGYECLYNAINNEHMTALNINNLDEVGIIPRVLMDLFRRIEEEQNSLNKTFKVTVSFVEIYNEEIKDLLNLKINAEPLNIREENNSIRVANLLEMEVSDAMETIRHLQRGSSQRVVGGTAMNDQSSRSHAIFTITLEQRENCGQAGEESATIKSKFHLVDLAGSERQSKTKAEGLRLKEGININLGLLALGNVISVLGEDNPSNKTRHVPYRESKLTRLLQDSLGGNSHTVMLACVSPADSNTEESLNTLRYADRARKIKNKPVVNIDPLAAELGRLRYENQELKAKLIQATGSSGFASANFCENSTEFHQMKEDYERLKAENVELAQKIHYMTQINLINIEKIEKLRQEKEDFKNKHEEIKEMFEKFVKEQAQVIAASNSANPDITMSGDANATLNQTTCAAAMSENMATMINEMQNKFKEFEQIKEIEKSMAIKQEAEQELIMQNFNEPVDTDYVMRQAKMQWQLTEYDSELAKKEQLFRKVRENTYDSINDVKLATTNIDELKGQIDALEREKDKLQDLLRSSEISKKQAEVTRERLKLLEAESLEVKKKEKEYHRMLKLKEENEKHCEKLKSEIVQIKAERVKLMKQMRADADAFKKFKQEKEKEVSQLKAQDRKRQVAISKLQEGNTKQEAMIRRKNEELSRIQKQLRETSEKQKQVAEKRQQAFDRKDLSAMGDKLRTWVTQELDLSVNIAEARINLNKMYEERKEAATELARLNKELQDLDNDLFAAQPAFKRQRHPSQVVDFDSTYIAGANDSGAISTNAGPDEDPEKENIRAELKLKIERLTEDIECKNVQINEAQQTVMEGDQDEKTKQIFNSVHGLMEAKVLLKHLYNSGVQFLLDAKLKQQDYETNNSSMNQELKDLKKKYDQMEDEQNKMKKQLKGEINELTQYYEQKLFYLVKEVLESPECMADQRFGILFDQIQQIEKKMENQLQNNAAHTFFVPNPPQKRSIQFNSCGSENRLRNEFNKPQKLKKEHRRTRVIHRVIPEIDVNLVDITNGDEAVESNRDAGKDANSFSAFRNMNVTNTLGTYDRSMNDLSMNSPSMFESPYAPSDDDRRRDPDWTKTPILGKKSKRISTRRL